MRAGVLGGFIGRGRRGFWLGPWRTGAGVSVSRRVVCLCILRSANNEKSRFSFRQTHTAPANKGERRLFFTAILRFQIFVSCEQCITNLKDSRRSLVMISSWRCIIYLNTLSSWKRCLMSAQYFFFGEREVMLKRRTAQPLLQLEPRNKRKIQRSR